MTTVKFEHSVQQFVLPGDVPYQLLGLFHFLLDGHHLQFILHHSGFIVIRRQIIDLVLNIRLLNGC